MEKSNPSKQEAVGAQLTEYISQLQGFSLGEGPVMCQVDGSSFSGGDTVVVLVLRPAGEEKFQVGDVVCGGGVHPFPVDERRRCRVLDAQLRRLQSWSTALQYIGDYCRWFEPAGGASAAGSGGGR